MLFQKTKFNLKPLTIFCAQEISSVTDEVIAYILTCASFQKLQNGSAQ